jgi:hypothetical protein
MPARKTTEEIDNLIKNRPICRKEPYVGYDTIILWQCLQCTNQWRASPNNIISKGSGCPVCSVTASGKRKSLNQYPRVEQILKKKYLKLISPFTRVIDRHTVQCVNCCQQRQVLLNNIVNKKYSKCPYCSGLQKLTNEVIDSRLKENKSLIVRIGDVVNARQKIQWKCNNGHLFNAGPDSILNKKVGCSRCNRKGVYSDRYFFRHPNAKILPGVLYLLEFTNNGNRYIKVGITRHNTAHRMRGLSKLENLKIISAKPMTLYEAFQAEQHILKVFTTTEILLQDRFAGHTECFMYSRAVIDYFNLNLGVVP